MWQGAGLGNTFQLEQHGYVYSWRMQCFNFFTILFTTKEGWLEVWNSLGEAGELQAAQVLFLSLYLTSSKITNGLYLNPADILVLIFIDLPSCFDTVDNIFILEAFFSLSFCNTSLPAFPYFSLAVPSQSVNSPLLSNEMPRGWVVGHFIFPSPKALVSTDTAPAWPLLWDLVWYLIFSSWYLKGTSHLTCPIPFLLWDSPSDWCCYPSKGISLKAGNHVTFSFTCQNISQIYSLLLSSFETSLIHAYDHFLLQIAS